MREGKREGELNSLRAPQSTSTRIGVPTTAILIG